MLRDQLLRASMLLALGCGGGMGGDDPAPTAEPTEGGEGPATEPDQDGGPLSVEPNAEGGEAVDVNGGDVGGSTSE